VLSKRELESGFKTALTFQDKVNITIALLLLENKPSIEPVPAPKPKATPKKKVEVKDDKKRNTNSSRKKT